MKTPPYDKGRRLMSIIDTAIFDYLIGNVYIDAHYGVIEPFYWPFCLSFFNNLGNADRHHYEVFLKGGDDAMVLHLDNGKRYWNFTIKN